MEIYLQSLIICAIFVIVNGFYIKEKDNDSKEIEDYSKILESWSNLKRKLYTKFNKDITSDGESSNSFNELEVIKMIPIIIDQYRNKKLTKNDENILSEIYGNLWSIICEEAERSTDNNDKNPLLEALLQSFYLTDNNINNDIDGNTIYGKKKLHKISKKIANKLLLNVNKSDHPSQRVLNTAAMLIHQVMSSKDINKKTNIKSDKLQKTKNKRFQRRATLNLQLRNIPIINDVTRTKRNLKYHISNKNNDLSSEKIDAILKIYKEQNGIKDYDDDDDDDDDDDYDENDTINKNDLLLMSSDARDDLYDDLYEDDQEVLSAHHDSDSFQDLILLAAKNRLREEEEENRLKHIKNRRHFLSTN